MKKWLVIFTAIVMMMGMAFTAQAATTDTFTITITINFIDINLRVYDDSGDYASWGIGQVVVSSANSMIEAAGIMIDNTSNVAVDIESWVGDSGSWTLAGAIGADTYTLAAKTFAAPQTAPDMTGEVAITQTASPGADITTGLAATTDQWIYYTLTAPSSVTSGLQNTITVTIAATAS